MTGSITKSPFSTDAIKEIQSEGFSLFRFLGQDDLLRCREIVADQLSRVLDRVISFDEIIGMDKGALADIQSNKALRTLNVDLYSEFFSLPSSQRFLSNFPGFCVSEIVDPIEGRGRLPEMYFRVVSPGSGGSPDHCHVDSWFDDAYGIPEDLRPVYKVWVSLMTEPDKNGLMFLKSCNWQGLSYELEATPYGPRPRLVNKDLGYSDFIFPRIAPGEAAIFLSSRTPHVGAPNLGHFNRISFEIALRKERNKVSQQYVLLDRSDDS